MAVEGVTFAVAVRVVEREPVGQALIGLAGVVVTVVDDAVADLGSAGVGVLVGVVAVTAVAGVAIGRLAATLLGGEGVAGIAVAVTVAVCVELLGLGAAIAVVVDLVADFFGSRVDAGIVVIAVTADGDEVVTRVTAAVDTHVTAVAVTVRVGVPGGRDALVDFAIAVVVDAVTDFSRVGVDAGIAIIAVVLVVVTVAVVVAPGQPVLVLVLGDEAALVTASDDERNAEEQQCECAVGVVGVAAVRVARVEAHVVLPCSS